jgi:hypothetical protein
MGGMISVGLAQRLHDAGLRWEPRSGDRFVIRARNMDDEVFVLSDMTIEVQEFPGGGIIKFNGTTEWALDSLDQNDALWLPGEDQLRAALAGTFRRLEHADGVHTVELHLPGAATAPTRTSHADAAEAYGLALLELIQGPAPASVAT